LIRKLGIIFFDKYYMAVGSTIIAVFLLPIHVVAVGLILAKPRLNRAGKVFEAALFCNIIKIRFHSWWTFLLYALFYVSAYLPGYLAIKALGPANNLHSVVFRLLMLLRIGLDFLV